MHSYSSYFLDWKNSKCVSIYFKMVSKRFFRDGRPVKLDDNGVVSFWVIIRVGMFWMLDKVGR